VISNFFIIKKGCATPSVAQSLSEEGDEKLKKSLPIRVRGGYHVLNGEMMIRQARRRLEKEG